MSLRTAMLVVKDIVLNITEPGVLDIRPHQLTIVTRTWLGGDVDAPVTSGPAYTDSLLVIPQKYRIKQLTTKEIVESAGRFQVGDMIVMGIVPGDPANPGVGYYPSQLNPVTVPGQEVIYVIDGPNNGHYTLVELRAFRILSYDLILRRRQTTPIAVPPTSVANEASTL